MILTQEIIDTIYNRAHEWCFQKNKIFPCAIVLIKKEESISVEIYSETISLEEPTLDLIKLEDLTKDLEITAENRKIENEKLEKEKRKQRFLEISSEYEELKKEFG